MKFTPEQASWFSRMQAEWIELFKPASTRLGGHIFDLGHQVPSDAVRKARVFGWRVDALDLLPRGGVVAEIGTQTGYFAERILNTSMPKALHLFDLEFDTLQRARPEVAADPRVTLHLGDSSARIALLPDAHFDWIYIDGDHSFEGVRRDADVAVRKIKPDGVLVFNDYTVWSVMEMVDYGIVPVVNTLLAGGEWEMVYIALHPLMYCDVAMRRSRRKTES